MELARRVLREVVDDRVTGLAAEIAFFALLGLFPALLMVASALSIVDAVIGGEVAERGQRLVTDALDRVFTDDAGGVVEDVDRLFVEQRPGVLTTATVGAFWALSRAFGALIVALDLAYDLPERRPWVRQRLIGLGIGVGTIAAAAVLLSMLIVGPLLGGGQAVADRLGFGRVFAFAWTWLRWPVAFALVVVWVTTLLDVAPAHRGPWRSHLTGGIVAAAGWLAASAGFRAYLAVAGTTNVAFGVLGGAIALLLWTYVLSLVLLVAAELDAEIRSPKRVAVPTLGP